MSALPQTRSSRAVTKPKRLLDSVDDHVLYDEIAEETRVLKKQKKQQKLSEKKLLGQPRLNSVQGPYIPRNVKLLQALIDKTADPDEKTVHENELLERRRIIKVYNENRTKQYQPTDDLRDELAKLEKAPPPDDDGDSTRTDRILEIQAELEKRQSQTTGGLRDELAKLEKARDDDGVSTCAPRILEIQNLLAKRRLRALDYYQPNSALRIELANLEKAPPPDDKQHQQP